METRDQYGKVYPDGTIEWAPGDDGSYWSTPEHRHAENQAYQDQLVALGLSDPPVLSFVRRTITVTTGEIIPVDDASEDSA